MQRANVAVNHTAFNVEKNASFAMQVFNAYYRTPDPTGKTYAAFPEFFLIKPEVLEAKDLGIDRQERKLLEGCKAKAEARGGYIGVSKYFDETFGYHWIRLSAFPFMLGDTADENRTEFYYLLNKFIEFTRKNPDVYGDLTDESETDNDISLMLRDIRKNAEHLSEKVKFYPENMLVEFDPDWPVSEVKKLLVTLEGIDQTLNRLFLEYLRYVMRKKMGLIKTNRMPRQSNEALEFNRKIAYLADERQPVAAPPLPANDVILPESAIPSALTQDAGHEHISQEQGVPVLGEMESSTPSRQGAPILEQDAEHTLNQAKVRSARIARLSADTVSQALKIEEEKIRLEALAVVAARKQIAEAEAACKVATERIEQSRQACLEEETRARELELTCKQDEELAARATLRRVEIAERVGQEAEQRQLLEAQLFEREQLKLDQERELRYKIAQRLSLVEQTNLLMESRIQIESAAARLAQENFAAEKAATLSANETILRLQQQSQDAAMRTTLSPTEVRLDEAGLANNLVQEPSQNPLSEVELEQEIAEAVEQPHQMTANSLADNTKLITLDFKAGHPVPVGLQAILSKNGQAYDPFAYEEQLNVQHFANPETDLNSQLDHEGIIPSLEPRSWKARLFGNKRTGFLAIGFGLATVVSLIGFLVFPLAPERAISKQNDQSKPISYSFTPVQSNESHNAESSDKVETQTQEPETYISFAKLKMTDHLRVVPSH